MSEQHSIREHIHSQSSPFRFQSVVWAPEKGGDGKARFAVEPMLYVPAAGYDLVDPMTQGNEFMIAFRNYVRIKEMMGYRHVGLSSDEITELIYNMWGKRY